MWSGDRQLAAPALATPDLAFPLLPHALPQPSTQALRTRAFLQGGRASAQDRTAKH